MERFFRAVDGKEFTDETECRDYEAILQEEQAVDAARAVVREQAAKFHEMKYPEGRPRTIAHNHVLNWLEYDMRQRPGRYDIPAEAPPDNVEPIKESA